MLQNELDKLTQGWEGVKRSTTRASNGLKPTNTQAGTVHCQPFFGMLQAYWNVIEGFKNFGSGSGIPALLAAVYASFYSKFHSVESQKQSCTKKLLWRHFSRLQQSSLRFPSQNWCVCSATCSPGVVESFQEGDQSSL